MNLPSTEAEAVLFEALLDAAADAIIVIDEKGSIRQVNRACADVFGYEPDELRGSNVAVLMPPNYADRHDGYLRRYRETGVPHIIGTGRTVEGRRRSGDVFPLELSVGEGRIGGERLFVGILRDLSERHRLLSELREREVELQQMMESALVPTGLLDGSGVLIRANQALGAFLEVPHARGLVLRELLAEQERRRFERLLRRTRGAGVATLVPELRFRVGRSGRAADGYLAPVPAHGGGPAPEVVVQLVDRTAQHEAEAAERATAERLAGYHRVSMLGAMTAGIAHEVNQPLGAIANYATAARIRLQRQGGDASGEVADLLDKITTQAERASDVIRRLRALAGGRGTERARLRPEDVLAQTERLGRRTAADRGILLEIACPPDLPAVSADPVQIQQVLLNLFHNALDSMAPDGGAAPPDSRVTLMADLVEGGLRFSVRDRGTGLDPEVVDRLLDPFFSSKSDGMGVGLSICRSIVEAHRGRLEFGNNAEGPGATFSFVLPTVDRETTS